MSDDEKLRYELRKKLKMLKSIRGSGTELISLYIPPSYPVAEASNKLKEEHGQASNIKSKSTRTNVQAALEKIVHYLKMFKKAPDRGIAIFCGNISKEQGSPDIQLFSIVPHQEIKNHYYRCDSEFFLEFLDQMLAAKDAYGLVVLDGRECTLAVLRGTGTTIVKKLNSTAHSKLHGKGGQSARRYQRLIEEEIENYYKRIGGSIDEVFLPIGIRQIIVGGPGPAKDNFMKLKPFNYQIKVLGVYDTGYTDEYGVQELTGKSKEIIAQQEAIVEKKVIEIFIKEAINSGLAVYGEKEVRNALLANKVSTLLVSENLETKKVKLQCSSCKKEEVRIMEQPQEEACSCGGKLKIIEIKDVADELLELAEQTGAKISLISAETSEGKQFLMGFHGIGALLRYK
ncbi:peptide chain release factor 1 [Candidatus Micrarchaeota archaeon]|nr:peptide chain release factor 1 [Candidatus Micrarchaeota archaeon]